MTKGKAHGRNSQGFKPDLGNSAVRHYRGASENVAMVEMRSQLAIERAGLVTLHLQLARRSSIPTIDRSDSLFVALFVTCSSEASARIQYTNCVLPAIHEPI